MASPARGIPLWVTDCLLTWYAHSPVITGMKTWRPIVGQPAQGRLQAWRLNRILARQLRSAADGDTVFLEGSDAHECVPGRSYCHAHNRATLVCRPACVIPSKAPSRLPSVPIGQTVRNRVASAFLISRVGFWVGPARKHILWSAIIPDLTFVSDMVKLPPQ